jgi:hypothetical protein
MFKKWRPQAGFNTYIRGAITALVATAAFAIAPSASANLLTWSFTGPGTTSAAQTGSTTTLNYSLTGPDVHTTQSWIATATAGDAGDYAFNWDYSGNHAFFEAIAFLNAVSPSSGSASLVNASTFGLFDFTGSYTFANVNAGDTLQFIFGGSNQDSTELLSGTVVLDQQNNLGPQGNVPEPGTIALLGLGALGFAALRRKQVTK